MGDINYLMTMSIWPPGPTGTERLGLNPCDTSLLPHHQPIRELRMTDPPTPLSQLAFKNALLKSLREFRVLGGMSHPFPCKVLQ